tara:strand:+ start:13383 stop:13625 length:243 start_codon:yes stop_codon:yes gene_type:complete
MVIELDDNGLVFKDDVSGSLQFGFCDMNCGYYIKKKNEFFWLFADLEGEDHVEIAPHKLATYLTLTEISFICEKLKLLAK